MSEIKVTRSDGTRLSPEEERTFLRETGLWWLRYASGPRKLSEMRGLSPEEARSRINKMNLEWAAMRGLLPAPGAL